MSVVAVVLCYGYQEFADYCAQALRGMDTILVDNGSPEPITSNVAQVIRLAENTFASGGYNACMQAAATRGADYAWLINDESLDLSAAMGQSLYEEAQKLDRLGAIAPAFPESGWHHLRGVSGSLEAVDWLEFDLLIPLSTWRDVGEYDTRFPGWGLDIDWGLRAMKKKYQCYVDGRYSVHQRPDVVRPMMIHKDPAIMARGLCEKYGVSRWEDVVQRWL